MIVRGAVRAIAGLALVAAVSACDDNPLAENREDAEYFRLSTSDAVVEVGGNISVRANVLNKYGAALVVNITASECDAKVSVVKDTIRSPYEYPELFRITGNTVGSSCVVVNGGGVTDTIKLRVVPASVRLSLASDTVASGSVVPLSVAYRSTTGTAAGGVTFNAAHTTFTVVTASVGAVDAQGNFTGQAPGQTWVRASYTDMGVTRRDSVRVTVVAGAFTGTVTQGTAGNATGSIAAATFQQGAIPFDANTAVRLLLPNDSVIRTHVVPGSPAGQIRVVLPYGLPAGTIKYEVVNMGPTEVAAKGTINLPSGTPAADPFEPDNTTATPKSMVPGEIVYGSLGGTDTRDMVRLTITTPATYRVSLGWNDGSDHDFYVRNPTNTGSLLTLEGGVASNPETGTVTLAAGTYYLRADVWTHSPIDNRNSTYYITVVQQ